jgi:hypothetical protein
MQLLGQLQRTWPSAEKLLPGSGDAAVMYANPNIFSLAAPCSSTHQHI